MNQHAFDFTANARQSDPWTSHAAADRVHEFASGHIGMILACLRDHGPQTANELAGRLPLNSVQIARRLSDMEKKRLAAPTGHCRMSAAGRPERVWSAF
jgi:hypothetical protein